MSFENVCGTEQVPRRGLNGELMWRTSGFIPLTYHLTRPLKTGVNNVLKCFNLLKPSGNFTYDQI
jgi:hypothetical protein